ncbi:sodium/proline symporter [Sulfobacillus acidophilus]|uniref:Sodium/proline symporter n=1 Tax=Sulfobacillus acidophilus TaxID=53633 RepID=A0ABS3AYM2_9FIRM|nr:sodium/proline symporter [Sulfobacillus acidophilus]
MNFTLFLPFIIYFFVLLSIGLIASKKQKTASDYILGGRSLNYWVAALSANASDMSTWLFLGLPALVFAKGSIGFFIGLGLIVGMFCNWHFIAPKLRAQTEKYGALTLFSYFEKRLNDRSGHLRLTSAIICLVFLTTYIAAGLIGIGVLFEAQFGINFYIGCLLGILAIIFYTLIGGFKAIAFTDFFQGIFLLVVVMLVPALAFVDTKISFSEISSQIFSLKDASLIGTLSIALGWGISYIGQPHILNKFMAIKNVNEIHKSKYLSMCWQILALFSSALVGFFALYYFEQGSVSQEQIFIKMAQLLFNPFFVGLILCGILAATLSTMDSQIIVLASVLAEDIYKKSFRKKATSNEVMWASRFFVVVICIVALIIAAFRPTTIFALVEYCFIGLGCSFGPVVVMCLYSKKINAKAALIGMITGGLIGALWQTFNADISAFIPGFFGGLLTIFVFSRSFPPLLKGRTSKKGGGLSAG